MNTSSCNKLNGEIEMFVRYKFQEQKTTEAACFLLKLHGGRMPYLMLIKLLYIADRNAIKEWERPITYDTYVSMKYGPVLSNTYNLITGKAPQSCCWNNYIMREGEYIKLRGEPLKPGKLSRADLNVLNRVNDEFGHLNRFKLANLTHGFPEYQETDGPAYSIPIENILASFGYSQTDIERVESEIEEETGILAALGE